MGLHTTTNSRLTNVSLNLPKLSSSGEIEIYENISEGNGIPYRIKLNNMSHLQRQTMMYKNMQIIIQIFIELRNALGYTSIPPHYFTMVELKNAIHIFQIEYARKYGVKFAYGYKVLKADKYVSCNNARDFSILSNERQEALGNEPVYINNYNPDEEYIDIYDMPTVDQLMLEAMNDAVEVKTMPRIYDNDYVKRRKKSPRRPIIYTNQM